MSEIKPSTSNENPLITENLPPIKEASRESEPYIPIENVYLRRRVSRLNTKMKKLVRKIEANIPKNIGSLYDGKNIKVKSVKNIGLMDKLAEDDKKAYNVFSNEDHIIKDLMTQFKEKNEKDKIPKLIRKRMAFNRLYHISDSSEQQLKKVKKSKKKYSLEEYQENILRAVDVNSVEQSEIMRLIQSFNELKTESNNVKALPPINIDIIRDHVYRKSKMIIIGNGNLSQIDCLLLCVMMGYKVFLPKAYYNCVSYLKVVCPL